MAHGFLTPTPVSGDNFWKNLKTVYKGLRDLYKLYDTGNKILKANLRELDPKQLAAGQQKALPGANQKALAAAPATKMLGAGAGSLAKRDSGLTTSSGGGLEKNNRPELPPGGPRLGATGGIAGKGGTFTNIGGISSGGGLNADTFFKQATTGVGQSGEYLTNAQRREAFIKSRQESVKTTTSAASPPISPDSGIEIVAAVNRNTQMIVSLVDAVKAQTTTEVQTSEKQMQAQETMMLRAASRQKESDLEQGNDLSGFMTPENYAKRKKNEEKKETGSKLKEFFRGPNPFQKPEGCGCSPFMPGPGGGMPFGGAPGGGGLPTPDFVDEYRDMNRRPGSRLGGGASVTRRGGGARRATRLATKIGGKGVGKAVGKGLGKGLLKKIPGVGVLAGGAFAAERAMKGDWLGAGGELLSGVASLIPGLGTAVSTGIDAGLMARDAGLTPFAKGGIVTSPVAGLVGEAGNEGVFPLEGSKGKKVFEMFGQGMIDAQLDNRRDFAKIQSAGLKQYYEKEGGFEKMGKGLKGFFASLAGGIASLLGGPANAGTLDQAADYLNGGDTSSLASFIGGLESGNDYTKMVGGKKDSSVLGKTISELSAEKGDKFAMGRYQIQMATAKDVLKGAGIDASKFKFDQAGQDKIFELLLKRRGIDDFMSGKISKDKFAKNLSMEWAALPKDASGSGYYDGVGSNKSLTSYSSVLGQLDSLKQSGTAFGDVAGAGASGLTKGTGTFIQGNTGASRGDHFHIGPDEYRLGGKSTEQGKKDAREAAFKVAKGLMAKGTSFYFSNLAGFGLSKPWYKGKGDKKTDEQLRNAILGEQNGHASRSKGGSWGGIDIATAHGTKLPVGVGAVKDRGDGFGNAATIMGTKGFVGHGASGSRATKSDELVAISPPPAPEGITPGVSPTSRGSRGGQRGGGSSPGSLQASAANPNTGTSMMATSQQVAMASASGGGATVINNYYTAAGGGAGGGVNGNNVGPGIGMESTGLPILSQLSLAARA